MSSIARFRYALESFFNDPTNCHLSDSKSLLMSHVSILSELESRLSEPRLVIKLLMSSVLILLLILSCKILKYPRLALGPGLARAKGRLLPSWLGLNEGEPAGKLPRPIVFEKRVAGENDRSRERRFGYNKPGSRGRNCASARQSTIR
jgi:hypothetical protein